MPSRWVIAALLVGCGRYRFDPVAGASDASGMDGLDGTDGIGATITWVQSPVAVYSGGVNPASFPLRASAPQHAVVFHVGCHSGSVVPPAGVALTAPGWTLTQLGPVTGAVSHGYWGASFGAISPNANMVTATVTWNVSACDGAAVELADEFAGVDLAAPFDQHAESQGIGDATTSLTTSYANEAIWTGLIAHVTAPPPGFMETGNDGANGDAEAYRITQDPAGTVETLVYSNMACNQFAMTTVSLKPAP
jgi:hypothetical protein